MYGRRAGQVVPASRRVLGRSCAPVPLCNYLTHDSGMKTRRELLKQRVWSADGLAAAVFITPAEAMTGFAPLRGADEMPPEDVVRELLMASHEAAKGGGASYSDVRIGRYRNSAVV